MPIENAKFSLHGVWLGDAFGTSLFFPQATQWIESRRLPEAPWRWTDDTHMALAVVEELRERGWIDQDSLARRLARGYLADPARGYGTGTAQILKKIAAGEYFRSAARSTFSEGSFGCSVASRSAPIGAYNAGNPWRAAREARLSAGVTTLHPEGIAGAEAVAIAAALAAQERTPTGVDFLAEVLQYMAESEVRKGIERSLDIAAWDMETAIKELGVGKQSTTMDTVPFALWCSAHHLKDLEGALWWAVSSMGLRNTLCALVGGIVVLHARTLPEEWLRRCERLPGDLAHRFKNSSGNTGALHLSERENKQAGALISPVEQMDIKNDPLTGLPNLWSLVNWAKEVSEAGEFAPTNLVVIHLTGLGQVNRERGGTSGDELFKWCARTLRAQRPGKIFRMGEDKFAILVDSTSLEQVVDLAASLVKSIDIKKFYPGLRPLRSAVIHFSEKKSFTLRRFLASLYLALSEGHQEPAGGQPVVFQAESILRLDENFPWMLLELTNQMLRLGNSADESIRLAFTDTVAQLPNMRAAMSAMETFLEEARKSLNPLAVLLIDGDNLREYNHISYEAGDEAIRLLGRTIQRELRATDFLARWRVGDEFLVLMPDTPIQQAQEIGRRLCRAVQHDSQSWLLPTSISIGAAAFPIHGGSVQELLKAAENGLDTAKKQGKNQVR